jgi:hypothetical protein
LLIFDGTQTTLIQKKTFLACCTVFLFNLALFSQVSEEEIRLLHQLDSAKNSGYIARYFAGLYFETTARAVNDFEYEEEHAKRFIQRMETRFAHFFFKRRKLSIIKRKYPRPGKYTLAIPVYRRFNTSCWGSMRISMVISGRHSRLNSL